VNAPTRLAVFAAGLVLLFGAAFVVAGAVVPEDAVADWSRADGDTDHAGDTDHPASTDREAPTGESSSTAPDESTLGLSLQADGLQLGPIQAPAAAGQPGSLSFRILDRSGQAVTAFDVAHEQRLHLIVVRTDGSGFRHVHPELAADGTWSLDWEWPTAGSHRVIADVVPSASGRKVTLARTVEVGGQVESPSPSQVSTTDQVDGFEVTLTGGLHSGRSSELTVTVRRGGEPVRTVEPYLGSYGHLVALREGDLAYLHVHPDQDATASSGPSGPEVGFTAEAPGPGRYLLFFDFRVDGVVRTAQFVLDADGATPAPPGGSPSSTSTTPAPGEHSGH